MLVNNVFITDIQEKANLFNDYFADQCTLIEGSDLPLFISKTNKVLSDAPFDESDIESILKNLKPNKLYIKTAFLKGFFLLLGKKLMLSLSIKRTRKIYIKTIAQFRFCQFLVKF